MKYSVVAQVWAIMDSEDIRTELAKRNPDYAEKWIDELDQLFEKQAEMPNRFSLAPESVHMNYPVRHVLVGRYRVLFVVRDDSVRILRIRHAARRPFKPDEID